MGQPDGKWPDMPPVYDFGDDAVREWIKKVGMDEMGSFLINPSKDKGKVTFDPPRMSLDVLLQYGKMLEMEQENVKRVQLADEYMTGAALAGSGGSSLPENYSQ